MSPSRIQPLVAAILLASSCAGLPVPPGAGDARAFADEPWKSPQAREHRLVGYALSVRDGRWVERSELAGKLASAEVVLLGETHDNPDHHRLQAAFLRQVIGAERKPVLAVEMFDTNQSAALAAALAEPGLGADGLAKATGWEKSGWPAFDLYRPVFEAGLEARLQIVAANLPRSVASAAVRKGLEPLPADVRGWMERVGEPPEAELAGWAREMEENHCSEIERELLVGMVRAQRARDVQMALAVAGAGERGVVLITGDGHARTDRGVPAWLQRIRPGIRTLSIGLVEADEELRWPRQYAKVYGPAFPFDYVIFTPRAERDDPCEQLRERKRKRAATPPAPAAAPPPASAPSAPPGAPATPPTAEGAR